MRLRVLPGGDGDGRDVIAHPIGLGSLRDLRYHEWEYTRRRMVEEKRSVTARFEARRP